MIIDQIYSHKGVFLPQIVSQLSVTLPSLPLLFFWDEHIVFHAPGIHD